MMALSALRAVTLCAIIQSALAEEPAEPLVEESLPPGPMEVPGLGSLDFLWNHYAMNMPLPDLLQEYRLKYGNLFTIKTGPVRQVWVSGPLADTILSRPEAVGVSRAGPVADMHCSCASWALFGARWFLFGSS